MTAHKEINPLTKTLNGGLVVEWNGTHWLPSLETNGGELSREDTVKVNGDVSRKDTVTINAAPVLTLAQATENVQIARLAVAESIFYNIRSMVTVFTLGFIFSILYILYSFSVSASEKSDVAAQGLVEGFNEVGYLFAWLVGIVFAGLLLRILPALYRRTRVEEQEAPYQPTRTTSQDININVNQGSGSAQDLANMRK